MGRCLNCIHFDVCDIDRHRKERMYGDCSDFFDDNDVVSKSKVVTEVFEDLDELLVFPSEYSMQKYLEIKAKYKGNIRR